MSAEPPNTPAGGSFPEPVLPYEPGSPEAVAAVEQFEQDRLEDLTRRRDHERAKERIAAEKWKQTPEGRQVIALERIADAIERLVVGYPIREPERDAPTSAPGSHPCRSSPPVGSPGT